MGSLMRFRLDEFIEKNNLQTFVETGTARGDSLAYAAERPEFLHLMSCEIEPLLAAGACCRFNEDPRVMIVRADSGLVHADGCQNWTFRRRCTGLTRTIQAPDLALRTTATPCRKLSACRSAGNWNRSAGTAPALT